MTAQAAVSDALILNRYLPVMVLVDTWPACGRPAPRELVASLPRLVVRDCDGPADHSLPCVWEVVGVEGLCRG